MIPIFEKVKRKHPGLELWFVGEGPSAPKLKEKAKGAVFLGLLNKDELVKVYSEAGILVLPSNFDTFGCVVLEGLSCGLPVAAYKTKGPKDIVEHGVSGYLGQNHKELGEYISGYFDDETTRKKMSIEAVERSRKYKASRIMESFMADIKLSTAAFMTT